MKFQLASQDRTRTLLIWTAAGIPGALTIGFVGFIGANPFYGLLMVLTSLGVCFEAGKIAWNYYYGEEDVFSEPLYFSLPQVPDRKVGRHASQQVNHNADQESDQHDAHTTGQHVSEAAPAVHGKHANL